jgi:hypothetical protein
MSKRKIDTPSKKPDKRGYRNNNHINVMAPTNCNICKESVTEFVLCFNTDRILKHHTPNNFGNTHTCFDCSVICDQCNSYNCDNPECISICNTCGINVCSRCRNRCMFCGHQCNSCTNIYCRSCSSKSYKCGKKCNVCGELNIPEYTDKYTEKNIYLTKNLSSCLTCHKDVCQKCSYGCGDGCGWYCKTCGHHCWGC